MTNSFFHIPTIQILDLHLIFFSSLPTFLHSLSFHFSHFDFNSTGILYQGDAEPSLGAIEFNLINYPYRVGWTTYAEKVPLWDPITGNLTDFTTHFSFSIDTQGLPDNRHGHGLVFFLAPFEFQSPLNSGGSLLGLFDPQSIHSAQTQIVMVEFDSFSNYQWDPPFEHVGINKNSISSSVYTAWNASFHSGDEADVWISYNSTTKNLTVSWGYKKTSNRLEDSSIYYEIDLMKVLPQWVKIGFSASTGNVTERHTLKSWEFNSSLDLEFTPSIGSKQNKVKIIMGVTISGAAVLAGSIIGVLIWQWKQKKRKTKGVSFSSANSDFDIDGIPKSFLYKDLAMATDQFSNERKLGEGGSGIVYKGYIADTNLAVAVKRISNVSKQGKKVFDTEVRIISRLRHRNLMQLLGWCHENNELLLVYELVPNSTLDSHLFGRKSLLPWVTRYDISLGLASALLYLHEEWEQCVLHRDIKSSNVLLDFNFNVKLGDFGLARLVDHGLGPQTTNLAGTLGYIAPECISTGRASKESDVFSFGVVALEIATGRKSIGLIDKDLGKGLVECVWDLYGRNELLSAVDDRLRSDFDAKQAECLMIVGLWCASPYHRMRPSIRQAIQVLNFEARLPVLPKSIPVLMYCIPSPTMSSTLPLITTSLDEGR